MLVPKKAPGEWRMVVETRHVNKVYEPVGGMSAATLDNKSRGWSQYIFTTLICKYAFYNLTLADEDQEML